VSWAARGAVAAMAMSAIRAVTTRLGLVERTPPEEISTESASPLFDRIPPSRRGIVRELGHWCYGAAGGVGFGLLPGRARAHPLAGPLYGLLTWALFEAVIAPLLGDSHRDRPATERAALIADHLVYGAIVGRAP
jgi:hypothetical protein